MFRFIHGFRKSIVQIKILINIQLGEKLRAIKERGCFGSFNLRPNGLDKFSGELVSL